MVFRAQNKAVFSQSEDIVLFVRPCANFEIFCF